jgi:glyoxylase-like metal-dependent hydrolase (beta-lactamase superfamily II)
VSATASRRVAVAGWELTLLDLGAIHAPLTWVFPDAPERDLAWLPSGGLLCRRGEDVVLVDCGLGPYRGIFDLDVRHVELTDALAGAGCPPQDVTTLILTHLDADHAGGVVTRDGTGGLRPSLPHARTVVLTEALDLLAGGAEPRSELEAAIGGVLRDGNVTVDGRTDGAEILPGLHVRAAPGHRAGHTCVEVSNASERFVFLADVIHAREHVANPEWDSLHDSDPELALATRRHWIDDLAGTGTVVACSHVDGFGRIGYAAGGTPDWLDVT